jgi:hypothetical protein
MVGFSAKVENELVRSTYLLKSESKLNPQHRCVDMMSAWSAR